MSNSQIERDPVREDILSGAKDLFRRFGFKKTTMEDIARQIGKSKSALYYYYKTKEEIFEAVLLKDMESYHQEATAAAEKEESAAGKFRVIISMLRNVKEKSNEFSIFRAEMFEVPFLIEHIARKRDKYMEDYLKNILILGISRGEVNMMTTVEIDVWSKIIHLTLHGLGSRLFIDNQNDYLLEHLDFIADALFKGVSSHK